MDGRRYLLDCTLRDGGYINDWKFGKDNLINVFERVTDAGVDVIEIGFLDDRRVFDKDRSIMPDTDSVEKIYGKLNRKNTQVVGMIDFGTCSIENVSECKDSFLDGIRVIFKKDKMVPAMEFCRQLIKKGYLVYSQLVSVTSYSDEELIELTKLANDIHPYAVSMVDTYGLLNPKSLTHIMDVLDKELDKEIILGFHAHNNFQLGYINACTALDYETKRDILVDATLYGMGKSAGNAPLELVAMYMNQNYEKDYKIDEIQEAIVTSILDIYKKTPWGYKLFFYIAASNKCHPNYVTYLMNKRTLSITAINQILRKIPDEEKLGKNQKLIEQLYLDYMKNECDDSNDKENLKVELNNKKLLVIGPASSVEKEKDKIKLFIEQENPIVISINYIPERFTPDYIFLTNYSRYLRLKTKLKEEKYKEIPIVATSNFTKSEGNFDFVMNYSNLIDESAEFPDNSLCMLMRLLNEIGCREVALAGFDGYLPSDVNYFEREMEYSFVKAKADSLNAYAINFFKELRKKMEVKFVTNSFYDVK